uniref:Ephrin type-B receptor 1 n=1 Tax=Sphaerodactylus townsendi TaxID=933632 RepID=A0ACB8FAM1_9SAUR
MRTRRSTDWGGSQSPRSEGKRGAHAWSSRGVPSGPRNVISIVNETSIILEWHPPRETGGRDDVTYNIVCKKCRSDRRSCSRCDDNVEFVPRQLGLTETRVFISSLWAHTPYTFEIQAVNGVSNKSPFPPQHVSVNITTNQAGKSTSSSFRDLPHDLLLEMKKIKQEFYRKLHVSL